MPRWLRTLVREPLVHFLLVGVAVFAVDAARGEPDPAPEERDAPTGERRLERALSLDGERARLAEEWRNARGHEPSEAELDAQLERWIDEEILYREGLALDLDQDDRLVRARVISKMGAVLQAQLLVPEPEEAELRAWFEEHVDRYAVADRIDFSHVFVDGADAAAQRRATGLLAQLEAGASPARLGDRFAGGRRYRGRALDDLARSFGDDFAAGLAEQPAGTWALRRSRHGLHLVRVDRREAGATPDFEAARLAVRSDWEEAQRLAAFGDAVAELRGRWRIEAR